MDQWHHQPHPPQRALPRQIDLGASARLSANPIQQDQTAHPTSKPVEGANWPELRIVSDDLWARVEARRPNRVRLQGRNLAIGRLPELRFETSFSGFLKCGVCGGAVVIVSSGTAAGPRYGCFGALRHHQCPNRIETSLKRMETLLLARLQHELNQPHLADFIIEQMQHRASNHPKLLTLAVACGGAGTRAQKLRHLVSALEDGEASSTVMKAIRSREASIAALEQAVEATRTPARLVIDPQHVKELLAEVVAVLSASANMSDPCSSNCNFGCASPQSNNQASVPAASSRAASLAALAGEVALPRRSWYRRRSPRPQHLPTADCSWGRVE